jgi:hypothetical protein
MKVNNKLFKSISLLSLIAFISCNGVPVAQVDQCVMPEESVMNLKNVTTSESVKTDDVNLDNDDTSEESTTLPRICVLPTKIDPLENGGKELDINANLTLFTPEQEIKMKDALSRLKLIVNSVEFKERVLAHTYNGSNQFVDNKGLTNEEIYLRIMEGAETLSRDGDGGNVVDSEMDIDIKLYYSSKNVVGYTYPNVLQIWVNKKYFIPNSLGAVAANVIHEWTHKIGFGHDYSSTSRRPYSVPYGVGTIVKDLINNM